MEPRFQNRFGYSRVRPICDHGVLSEISGRRRLLSRRNADAIFRDESIRLNGIPSISWTAWAAVRLVGVLPWRARKKHRDRASFQVERRVQNPFLAPDLKM